MKALEATTTSELAQSYIEYLENTYSLCLKDIGNVSGIASALCAIFALFFIGNMIWKSWCQGGSINLYALFKPFCIAFIIANFTIFTQMIDGMTSLVNKPLYEMANKQYKNASSALNKEFKEAAKENNMSENNNVFDELLDATINLPEKIVELITSTILTGISLFGILASLCILTFAYVVKLVLFYLGPLVFALSLIPYFSGGISSWIGRYITVSLYAPCINIINYLLFRIMENYISFNPEVMQVSGGQFTNSFGVVLFGLASAFCYISVPSIAGYIVQSGGAEALTHEARHRAREAKDFAKRKLAKESGGAGAATASMVNSVKK